MTADDAAADKNCEEIIPDPIYLSVGVTGKGGVTAVTSRFNSVHTNTMKQKCPLCKTQLKEYPNYSAYLFDRGDKYEVCFSKKKLKKSIWHCRECKTTCDHKGGILRWNYQFLIPITGGNIKCR